MKAEKIREIDSKDLATRLKDADEQMFRLKFQMSMGQTEGLKKYRELKKDRARMRTVLGERARSEQKGTV
ncbi:MAG: 50S ribosomal protein L29 [Bryobacteraceae bacterium]|jgi:large subunit ribosomal protein L29|nr:50S ribosomal protein L29 [Bryobacteraceae bacterium]